MNVMALVWIIHPWNTAVQIALPVPRTPMETPPVMASHAISTATMDIGFARILVCLALGDLVFKIGLAMVRNV